MKCPHCDNIFNDDALFLAPSGEMLCAKCLNALWRPIQDEIIEQENSRGVWIDRWGNVPDSPALVQIDENLKFLYKDRSLIEDVLEEYDIAEDDVRSAIQERRIDEDFDEKEYTGGEPFDDFSDHENLDD